MEYASGHGSMMLTISVDKCRAPLWLWNMRCLNIIFDFQLIMVVLEYVMSQSSSVDNGGAPAHLWPDLFASLPWLPQGPASEKGIEKLCLKKSALWRSSKGVLCSLWLVFRFEILIKQKRVICDDHQKVLCALCGWPMCSAGCSQRSPHAQLECRLFRFLS